MPEPQARPDAPLVRTVALRALIAGLIITCLKFGVFALTNSAAVLSDALESIINLAAASVAYLSLRYSSRPADASHTYGHEKIEFFAGGVEGVLILVAAAGIAWIAVQRLLDPRPLESLGLGTALTTVIRIHAAEVLADLGVPDGRYEIAALVPVGHPAGNFGVAPRKPAAAVTHWNRWGDRRR